MTRAQAYRFRPGNPVWFKHGVYGWCKGVVQSKQVVPGNIWFVINVTQPHVMQARMPYTVLERTGHAAQLELPVVMASDEAKEAREIEAASHANEEYPNA